MKLLEFMSIKLQYVLFTGRPIIVLCLAHMCLCPILGIDMSNGLFKALCLMVAYGTLSGPTTIVILVVDYLSPTCQAIT